MINLDKVIEISCPAECLQKDVSCSIRMILQQKEFVCDSCGYKFCGEDHPDLMSKAVCLRDSDARQEEYKIIVFLYDYFYADGAAPKKTLIKKLLKADPELFTYFPVNKLPIAAVLDFFDDEKFVAQLDFSLLEADQIITLIDAKPEFADKCDLSKLPAEQCLKLIYEYPHLAATRFWKKIHLYIVDKDDTAGISQKLSNDIFEFFPYKNDSRFILSAPENVGYGLLGSDDIFWCIVNYFNFYRKVDWQKFPPWKVSDFLKKYPMIFYLYPYNKDNLLEFDWKAITYDEWKKIRKLRKIIPTEVQSIYNLCSGRKIAEILVAEPELEFLCNWSRMRPGEWVDLINAFPDKKEYWEVCDWNTFRKQNWEKIIEANKCDYVVALAHVASATEIVANLKKYPEFESYIDWEKINGFEWMQLLAAYPEYTGKCNWESVYEYIAALPIDQQRSVRSLFPDLWTIRQIILANVNMIELQKLDIEKYYTILDFFDWEYVFDFSTLLPESRVWLFSTHPGFLTAYGVNKLTSAEKVELALCSPEFGNSYGWQNFSQEEAVDILKKSPDYYKYFKNVELSPCSWRKLCEYNKDFASKYRLSCLDYLLYRTIDCRLIDSKITFAWNLVLSMIMFVAAWCFMYDGPCGFKVYESDSHSGASFAEIFYIVMSFIWSVFHAWLFSGRTPFFVAVCAAWLGGGIVALQYSYTFFLTKFSLANYICCGLFVFSVFIFLCMKLSNKEININNREAVSVFGVFYLPVLLITVLLCQPFFNWQYRRIYRQLSASAKPFSSAAMYYLLKAYAADDESRQLVDDTVAALQKNDCKAAQKTLEKIYPEYNVLPAIKTLNNQIAEQRRQSEANTKNAIDTFRKGNYGNLKSSLALVDRENPEIQFIIGKCFDSGLGGYDKDYSQAAKWYQMAADQKNSQAMLNLGRLYSQGKGVAHSYEKAYQLYLQAAEAGLAEAQCNTASALLHGQGVPKDHARAYQWFGKAAQQNHPIAQRNVALMSYCAMGTEKNESATLKWLQKAADQGDTVAQQMLGSFYLSGIIVEPDYARAVKLLTEAAGKNDPTAQVLLGRCYANGQGGKVDGKAAVEWLTRAAEQNVSIAQLELFKIYSAGKIVPANMKLAIKWLKQAAEKSAEAQYDLGVCYLEGQGVNKDKAQAEYFLKKAQANGYEMAGEMLKKMHLQR